MGREANLAGWIKYTETYHLVVASGTSAEEWITDALPGFRRTLVKAFFIASGDGAGTSASRLIRVLKNTATIAASHTLLLAETATKGLVTALTLSTTPSDYQFYDADTLSIDTTAAGTQFTTLTITLALVWKTRAQQD